MLINGVKYYKIENITKPVEIGEKYIVPCIVKRNFNDKAIKVVPIIDSPHNDRENGQSEIHYHSDTRFIICKDERDEGRVEFEDDIFEINSHRVELGIDGEMEHHVLPVISTKHTFPTQLTFIRNSNLRHKCIHKGKCPHRGFDLSREKPVNGKITCPLHGLVFDEKTGEIDKDILEQLTLAKNIEIKYHQDMKKSLSKFNKIKDGDVITQKQYDEMYQYPLNSIFCIIQRPSKDGYIDYEWIRDKTFDYRPKPLENKITVKFRVKL